jgi:hypothetical protein
VIADQINHGAVNSGAEIQGSENLEISSSGTRADPLSASKRQAMSFEDPRPFQINVPDSLLELTKQKLQNARLPDQLKDVVWEGNSLKWVNGRWHTSKRSAKTH